MVFLKMMAIAVKRDPTTRYESNIVHVGVCICSGACAWKLKKPRAVPSGATHTKLQYARLRLTWWAYIAPRLFLRKRR